MLRNILICTTQVPFTAGGAEQHVEGLKQALTRHGYNAEIVALPFKWYPPSEIMRGALAWRMLDLSTANGKPVDLVIGMRFPAYVVAHERKLLWVIHQHRSAYNLWGTAFDDLSTYPDGVRVREWIQQCDQRFIPEAKKVFANSKTVAARLQRFNNIASEPLYHPPPRAEQLRTGEYGDYILYPSRLEPQKRQELLIEAVRHVRTNVRIIFAGGSKDQAHYESLAKKLAVADRICFRGFVSESEILELYANALAVCYLPFDEDYGYVTLEAMLCAKPVIVPGDGGGATEFIEDQRDGFIVDAIPEEIADRIDTLYEDRKRAVLMGQNARDKILALKLSWDHVVESLINAA